MLLSIIKVKILSKASSFVKLVVVLLRCRLVKLGRKNSEIEFIVLIIVISNESKLVNTINK